MEKPDEDARRPRLFHLTHGGVTYRFDTLAELAAWCQANVPLRETPADAERKSA